MFDNIQYAQSFNGNVCEIGSYIGNGTHGEDNPTTITFGSYPALVVVTSVYGDYPTTCIQGVNKTHSSSGSNINIIWSGNSVGLAYNGNAYDQNNENGVMYKYCMFSVLGGQFEWTITSSGTWTVPKTGRYYIELYGAGGGSAWASRANGGSSCQSYDSITLTKGDVISVTIGAPTDGGAGGRTTFGSYSVNGGQAGGVTGTYNGGAGAGNKGTNGTTSGATNPSNGMFSDYGYGTNAQGAYATLSGGPGAVYLKYLGE